jgi:O-antigen ligase
MSGRRTDGPTRRLRIGDLRGRVAGRAFVLPGLILVLVALGGRYTLDRAGLRDLQWVDLRLFGILVGLIVLAIDLARRPRRPAEHRPEGWLVVATLFFLYQIASGLWAPPLARVGPDALDVFLMGTLTVAIYLYTLGDPSAVVRWTFLLFYLAAVVFALGALLVTGPGEQGRYAAFGGGPNVFVRIEILGVISAVALYRVYRRKLVFVAVPLFLFAAVLSGSRAGLLAGAAVGIVALLRSRGRRAIGQVVLVTLVTAVVAAVAWTRAPSNVTSLIQQRFVQQTVEQGYASGRTSIWWDAIQLALAHPFIGAGLDGFYGLIGHASDVEYPHQYLLAVAAEGGIVGLALLLMSAVLWGGTVRRGRHHAMEKSLTVAAAAYVAISSLFSGDYYDARLAWLFAAMAAAAAITAPGGSPASASAVAVGGPAGGAPAGLARSAYAPGPASVAGSAHVKPAASARGTPADPAPVTPPEPRQPGVAVVLRRAADRQPTQPMRGGR